MLLICNRQVPGSNLALDMYHPDRFLVISLRLYRNMTE